MKGKSQVVVDVRSISQSPRRLRAKYTHRTNQRFVLRVFRPAGGYAAERQMVRKQAPERLLTKEEGVAYSKKFIYPVIKAAERQRQNQLYSQPCQTGKPLCGVRDYREKILVRTGKM